MYTKLTICKRRMPDDLEERIMHRVTEAARRQKTRRTFFGLSSVVLFVAASVAAGYEVFIQSYLSGFDQYISLLFVNGGVVLSDWHDFVLTLVESMPTWSTASLFAATALAIIALRWTAHARERASLGSDMDFLPYTI